MMLITIKTLFRRVIRCFILVAHLMIASTVSQFAHAQAFDHTVTIEKLSVSGDPNWDFPNASGLSQGLIIVVADNGNNYLFSMSDEAHISLYQSLLSVVSTGREVMLHGVASCGCGCSYALTGFTLD